MYGAFAVVLVGLIVRSCGGGGLMGSRLARRPPPGASSNAAYIGLLGVEWPVLLSGLRSLLLRSFGYFEGGGGHMLTDLFAEPSHWFA